MTRFRPFLCWLLCALLISAGMPTERGSRCSGAANDRPTVGDAGRVPMPCCADHGACCCPVATAACGCEQPEQPPLPAPTPPKQPLGCDDSQPLRTPTGFAPVAPANALPPLREHAAVRTAILPRRSRQEALSVWRC